MKFSIKDFFSKYDQIRSFLRIWSHLLKKSFMEKSFFCAVFNLDHEEREMLYRKVYEFQEFVKTKIKSSKRLSIVLPQNTR